MPPHKTFKGRKRTPPISLSVLPGEPTDGSGKICVHLLVEDKKGLIAESMLHPVYGEDGQPIGQQLQLKPVKCRLACDPKRLVVPVVKNGITHITMRTDSPEAVTCPKCKQSNEYLTAMKPTQTHLTNTQIKE